MRKLGGGSGYDIFRLRLDIDDPSQLPFSTLKLTIEFEVYWMKETNYCKQLGREMLNLGWLGKKDAIIDRKKGKRKNAVHCSGDLVDLGGGLSGAADAIEFPFDRSCLPFLVWPLPLEVPLVGNLQVSVRKRRRKKERKGKYSERTDENEENERNSEGKGKGVRILKAGECQGLSICMFSE